MVDARLRITFFLLGWVVCLPAALGAESPLNKQQEQQLLEEVTQLDDQRKKLFKAGQYEKAIPLAEKALAICKSVLGPRHPRVAESMSSLGRLYARVSQFAKAEPLYQESLAIRKEVFGPRHPKSADSLRELGLVYTELAQYTKAEPLYLEALAIQREALGPRHPDISWTLQNLGRLYAELGQYAKAERLYQESLALRKEALGPRHSEVATLLNNLGSLYVIMGQYARAEPIYQESLSISKEVLGPQHPLVGKVLNNVGSLYREMGQYAKAESLYQESLAIAKQVLGPRHLTVGKVLNNLGALYLDMGQYDKVEPLYQEALAIHKEVLGPRHPSVALSLNNLGELYNEMGQYDKVEPLYQEALAIQKEALGPRHPEVAKWLHNLALFHLSRPDRREVALPILGQSIDSSEQFLSTIVTESRVNSLLQTLRRQEEDVYSLLAENPSVSAIQQLAFSLLLLRKGRSAEEGVITQHAIQQTLTNTPDRTLFDRLTAVRSQLASLYLKDSSSEPDYRKTLVALETEADGLEQTLAEHSAAFHSFQFPGPDKVVARVAQALPKDAVLVEWLAFTPRHFTAKGPQPRWGAPRYLALVLFPEQRLHVVDLGEVRPIDEAIGALQKQLRNRRHGFRAAAQKLHGLVMDPLKPVLAGRTNLLVSPDGALNLVPLWALHDGKHFLLDSYRITYLTSGRDLLRPVAAAPPALSMAVLANPEFRLAATQGAPAAPAASDSRAAFLRQLDHVPSLPGTAVEAQAIHKLFPQARMLLGREASEKALRTLQAPAVLHIATHGVFWDDRAVPQYDAAYQPGRTIVEEEAPLAPGNAGNAGNERPTSVNPLARSALILAGVEALGQPGPPPPDDNDGLITALDVAGLNLWGTELVVLSACDTGRGAVQLGQGVYGLRRAFFNAGAETLVASLWPVSDEATQGLMSSYYRNLLAGQGRVEAMRKAALAVRAKQPHPYYWAPFIVLGKGDPLHGVPASH